MAPPRMFDWLPLIDSMLAASIRAPSCESLQSLASSSTTTDSYSRPCTSSNDSIHTTATSAETESTHSSIRPPSLYSGGRRGPRKRVSFSPSVTARDTDALDLAGQDFDDDELGADLSTATRAEKAIYKHTLRSKGMAAAIAWWEWKRKEKRRLGSRSMMSLR